MYEVRLIEDMSFVLATFAVLRVAEFFCDKYDLSTVIFDDKGKVVKVYSKQDFCRVAKQLFQCLATR